MKKLIFILVLYVGFPAFAPAQIVGTADDLLDDSVNFSVYDLQVKRYVMLPTNPSVGALLTRRINAMTTRPGDPDAFYTTSLDGRVYRITDDGGGQGQASLFFNAHDFIDLTTENFFHGGLRSIAFHPEFDNSISDGYGKLYGSLVTTQRPGGENYIGTSSGNIDSVVAEWTYDFNSGQVGSYRELFRVKNPQFDHPIKVATFNTVAQLGDEDYGLLYIGHGDGSVLGQGGGTGLNTENALGKILRVNPLENGSLPYTTPGNLLGTDGLSNTLSEIYSFGHRNPHNLSFGRDTEGGSHVLVTEIGQDNIDEVNISVNGGSFGWGDREGTFVKVPNGDGSQGIGYGVGQGVQIVPSDDHENGYIYPVIQLDHNDPTDGGRFGLAGGSIANNRFVYSQFAGNRVSPGGQIYSVDIDDLVRLKTVQQSGETVNDLEWIDDHLQHRLAFDHDNNPLTAPRVFDDFAQLISSEISGSTDRTDIRFGLTNDGDLLFSSKVNGAVYLVSNPFNAPGDFDFDGDVKFDDIDQFSGRIGDSTLVDGKFDFDGDGLITLADHDFVITNYLERIDGGIGSLVGDLNRDGQVNVLNDAFLFVFALDNPGASGYQFGDLNADGQIDILGDAFRLVGNLGQSVLITASSSTTVPEPNSIFLLVAVALRQGMCRKWHR